MAERDLWKLGRAGDSAATEELMRIATQQALRLLQRKGITGDELYDLTAETQLDVLRVLRGCGDVPRNVRGFLYYRTRGVLSRHWRLRAQRVVEQMTEARIEDTEGEPGDTLEALHQRSLLSSVESCVRALPEPLRQVHRMLVEEGLCQREIAERLGKSEAWVYRRVAEARARVTAALRGQGYSVPSPSDPLRSTRKPSVPEQHGDAREHRSDRAQDADLEGDASEPPVVDE